jgi:hypothetical protein
MEYSNPYERKERDKQYHDYCAMHPTGDMAIKWLNDHPDTSTEIIEKLIAIDNPLGDGVSDTIIRQVIGEVENIGEWFVAINKIELMGDVTIQEVSQ